MKKRFFKWTALAAVLCLTALTLAGCGSNATATSDGGKTTTSAATGKTTAAPEQTASGEYASGTHHAEIVVKDYGTITVELDADTAPITVANFCKLANEKFYDGLTFHRIISGFMIQGGDPKGNGTGGSGQTIKGEFAANGVKNGISHKRGVISMARSNSMNSASSQFFIMHADASHLDGQYAAFGHVTSGMEVVDAICENTPTQDSNGTVKAADQPVIESVRILD